jgi:hypothetical protein
MHNSKDDAAGAGRPAAAATPNTNIAISVTAFGSYRTSGHLPSLFCAKLGAVSEAVRGCGLLCCTGGT